MEDRGVLTVPRRGRACQTVFFISICKAKVPILTVAPKAIYPTRFLPFSSTSTGNAPSHGVKCG